MVEYDAQLWDEIPEEFVWIAEQPGGALDWSSWTKLRGLEVTKDYEHEETSLLEIRVNPQRRSNCGLGESNCLD